MTIEVLPIGAEVRLVGGKSREAIVTAVCLRGTGRRGER